MIGRRRTAFAFAWLALALGLVAATSRPAPVQAQDDEQAMVSAGRWVLQQIPGGDVRLDPHRTGRSTSPAVAQRVAGALNAQLGTLEQTQRCADPLDPSTCRLEASVLLAIAAPAIRGETARVRVYAWYRQDSPRQPVAKKSWDVTLRRTGSGWEVQGGSRSD